ncbi:MAG: hypothetical protein HFE59_02970 [Clostridiales bacterium]|nr:hypothetical protein [Clostridiales bacterium]
MLRKISEKLIKYVSKNFGWKLFSVVCAVVLWFIVMNIINPTEMQTFSVNVTFLNEDKLTERGFAVINKEEIENTRIDIKVKSTRTALDELSKNKKEITATVDLKQFAMLYADDLNEPFKVAVTPVIPTSYVYTYELVNFIPAEISVKLDNVVEVEKEVKVDSEGELSNGYLAGETVVMPPVVKVKGASSIIDKIDSVKVFLDFSDVSEGFQEKFKPIAFDQNGNELNSLLIDPETVQVSIGIYKYGKIPVERPTVEGSPGEGFEISKIEWEPKYIEVVGEEAEISKVGAIKPIVKIDGDSENQIVKTFDVNAHIAKNKLSIKSGAKKEVTVTIDLAQTYEKEIPVRDGDISFEGADGDKEVYLASDVKIKVKGVKEIIDNLNESDIKGKINVAGLSEGEHSSLKVEFELPDGVELSEAVFADVKIERVHDRQEESQTETSEEVREAMRNEASETNMEEAS